MDIRILPGNIANMIAAGEVVQRPASVVKELMENAVDAGATQVSVILTDAGRTLIQVIDNGCGMTPDEAVLCFERHATSKIATAEDLNDITTFGANLMSSSAFGTCRFLIYDPVAIRMALSRNLMVGGVAASRAGVVGIVSALRTGRNLGVMMDEVMT